MIRKIVVFGLIIVGFYFVVNIYEKEEKKEDNTLPTYVSYKVKRSDLDNYVEASGVVEAKDEKKIFIDKSLKVKELYFEEGDYVKKDELIMVFDDEERNSILRNIEKQEIEIKKLKRDYENSKALFDLGGSSLNEIEDLEYDIRTAELSLDEYQEELEKTIEEIRSPFEGTITSMVAEQNYRVNTEEELLEIADLSNIVITADVPEYDISNVKIGQSVRVKPEVFEKKKTLMGKVVEIANISTESDSSSQAYVEVTIELESSEFKFLPGFTADVEIVYQNKKDTIFVPRTAVLSKNEKNYVYIIDKENVILMKEVELGISNKETIEIVKGLEGNEDIIEMADKNLEEGTKINIGMKEIKLGDSDNMGPGPGGGRGR
jgi:RND family efflux transporter MFP subunit